MGEDFSHDLSWWKHSELDKKKCFGICITDEINEEREKKENEVLKKKGTLANFEIMSPGCL